MTMSDRDLLFVDWLASGMPSVLAQIADDSDDDPAPMGLAAAPLEDLGRELGVPAVVTWALSGEAPASSSHDHLVAR
jgi:hypothetical protein